MLLNKLSIHRLLGKTLSLGFLFFLLGACQEVLYHQLDERDANRAVSVLRQYCIAAVKKSANGGVFDISVPKKDFTKAVMVLRTSGLPARKYESLGQLFQPSGLVPTPFEEKVRYAYGLSQEVEQTLSMIEGVLAVRAHVALNVEGNAFTEQKDDQKPRISVYLRYDDSYDVFSLVPQIKKVVSDSVFDVDYENVVVLALPSSEEKPLRSQETIIFCDDPITMGTWFLWGFLLLGGLLIVGGGGFLWWRGFFSKKEKASNMPDDPTQPKAQDLTTPNEETRPLEPQDNPTQEPR